MKILAGFLIALAAGTAACDIPTSVPRYDTRWDVVVVRDSIATADLLPEHLRVGPEGFVIDEFSAEGEVRLGDVCELCTCFSGAIPAFDIAPHDWPVPLPSGVLSASLERGSAEVVLFNRVGFDLLSDGLGNQGWITVELMDTRDRRVLGRIFVAEPFPPGDSIRVSFDLADVPLSRYLVAQISGRMPGSGCQEVALTPESAIGARVELDDVVASSVEVWVGDQALKIPGRDFQLPAAVASRLRSGEAELTLEVAVETRLPAGLEIGMSAAGAQADLFSARAALYTPLLIPRAAPAAPEAVRRLYVVQLDPLQSADHLYLDTRNRFLESGPMVLRGGESVAYEMRVRARVPSR